MTPRVPGAREHLVRLCLLSWPPAARERDGEALVRALLDAWADPSAGVGGLSLLAECGAVLVEGSKMRLSHAASLSAVTVADAGRDVGTAVRSLRRDPGFTGTVALSFALGIGANAAVFDIVDRVLFTPPPFEAPDALVFAWATGESSTGRMRVAAPDAAELAADAGVLAALAFVGRPVDGGLEVAGASSAAPVRVARVTPNLFEVLGVRPTSGRTLAPSPDEPGIVLSHAAWLRIFAGDSAAVGGDVLLNGEGSRVVGVLPVDFRLPMPPGVGMGGGVDVWAPLSVPLRDIRRADGRAVDQDTDNTGAVIARLPAGAGVETAAAQADRVAARLRAEHAEYAATGLRFAVRPLREDATAHVRPLLRALLIGAGALLLVTCLNVSTMTLARSARRHAELAVRASLGAGRATLVRALGVEALTLVAVGGAAAVVVADTTAAALAGRIPPDLWAPGSGRTFWTVAFAVLLAGGATAIFTIVPAARLVRVGSPSFATLRGGPARAPLRGLLVAGQVATSVVVVLATGLLARAAQRAYQADLGFDPEGSLTFALSVRAPDRYRGPADRARLVREIESGLFALRGVTAVGVTTHLPLSRRLWTQPYELEGDQPDAWGGRRADFRTVSSGYFAALGARLIEGRAFTRDEDLHEEGRVVVIDDLMAARLGTGSALGRTIRFPLDGSIVTAEVVGVVGHVRPESPIRDGRETLWVPYRQEATREVSFVVRTDADPASVAADVRRVVREVDPQLPVHDLRTLESYVDAVVAPTRFAIGIVGAFAVLVLLAVGIGIYGVLSLEVGRRRREIGVRIAVGASRSSVAATVVGRTSALAGIGATVGAATALALSGLLTAAAPGVSVIDPVAWGAVTLTIGGVAGLASWLPLRRLTRLDTVEALRAD